ncbi:uncharacterized protein EV154DRAFT_203525 [Mucor mucedo]|uniref:uncharacterized protein n=1 Tax=Mucor mucedo TaxID=29922 RepID=UPI00221FB435|nr:uncharacterized protein EV154DRAFT_203525 [Mucor mucedo]KAI7892084.1 hypothetical protein EV154DRAFT_203525 [Mucor mucedo]
MGYICTICTDFIEIPGEKPVSTSCGHTFHDKCIREWLGSALKCPLCNRHTTVNNIHSLYLSSENNQSTANRSRLQNNLKSAAINLRQAKEELVKAKETLKAAELKASDALAVNRECEKLKSEKVALERTKYSLAVSITEKNAIISQKDKSIEALEAQIRKQKSSTPKCNK